MSNNSYFFIYCIFLSLCVTNINAKECSKENKQKNHIILDKKYYYIDINECKIPIIRNYIKEASYGLNSDNINIDHGNNGADGIILIANKKFKLISNILKFDKKYYKLLINKSKYGFTYFIYKDLLYEKLIKKNIKVVPSSEVIVIYFRNHVLFTNNYNKREIDYILDYCNKTQKE